MPEEIPWDDFTDKDWEALDRANDRVAGQFAAGVKKATRNELDDASVADMDTVVEALVNHGYDDWYIALLHTAFGGTEDMDRAIQVANAAYEDIAADPDAPPVVEATWQALGVTRAQALEAFGLHGEAVFAQDPEAWEQFKASLDT